MLNYSTTRALWFVKPKTSVIRETELPELKANSVIVEASYSAISPGTERLVYQGLVPKSMSEMMKVPYMEGDFSFPIKYGYSLVGRVIDGDEDLINSKIHVMHPHQEMAIVDKIDVTIIPKGIGEQRAALISNMETCVNAIWDSGIKIGDRVVIVGFGTIGSLLAMILKQMSLIDIMIVDVNELKLQKAKQFGFEALKPEETHDLIFDLAFHSSATGAGLNTAINLVGKEGKIVELSWYGSQSIALQLGTSFHVNRKQIISSQVATISPSNQSRWDHNRRKQFVLDILMNTEFNKLITRIIDFETIGNSFSDLTYSGNQDLSLLVRY